MLAALGEEFDGQAIHVLSRVFLMKPKLHTQAPLTTDALGVQLTTLLGMHAPY